MKKVFIIGAGQMGLDIGQVMAKTGYQVVFNDMTQEILDNAVAKLEKALDKMVSKGKMAEDQKASIMGNVSTSVDLAAAADADLIIEAIVENVAIKKDLFAKLDAICKPEAIFATNTSSISITEIASATKRQDKVIGMHFFNPATVMKLVEVINGLNTSKETFETVYELSKEIGKDPVEVKEGPGFVVNRILIPMINEAAIVLEEGLASAEDIDKSMKLGCNHPMGPLAHDVTRGLRKNGSFLLNTIWEGEELAKNLPNKVKKYFAQNNITVYYINATQIAQEIGLGNRTNTILQSAFFRITGVIPVDLAVEQMKKFIVKSYGKKGEDVVNKNYAAVDRGGEYKQLTVDPAWANLADDAKAENNDPAFINEVVRPINAQDGDLLPVSAFKGIEDGTWEQGTAKYEKRGVAAFVPEWNAENCIQCNKCAYVCPHASIRPFVLDAEEQKGANFTQLKAVGKAFDGMTFRIQVDVLDCLGCGNCADVCPGNPKKGGKALTMKHLESQLPEAANWTYCAENVKSKQHLVDIKANVKNSQFATPLFEFSGACSGCGETPYVKLISQLFGDREMVANATGCSSIYSGSVPSTPYTKNEKGHGPAWANSLFEDFCEFGLGMELANEKMRARIVKAMEDAIAAEGTPAEYKEVFQAWIENMYDADKSKELAEKIIPMVEAAKDKCDSCKTIASLSQYLVKRSQWIIGGDGASYDIGYGGLDHVIASGKDVNILVLDTEVYSNTGGQSSKATPVGAIAKFAAAGKRVRKKDLGLMATTYGYVYVAQIAMGADQAQTLKAIREAEAYPGPSLIIAYAPCINHGLKAGMGKSQAEEEKAVKCGYWHLWRYNPALEAEGKNPFTLDSKEPDWSGFQDFLKGEVRYASVMKQYPQEADELFKAAEENAKWRYNSYKRLSKENWGAEVTE